MSDYPYPNISDVFNSNNFKSKDDILSNLDQTFLKKNQNDELNSTINIKGGLVMNSNLISNNDIITPNNISCLKDISENIQDKLSLLQQSINNTYSGSNTYSGNNFYLGVNNFSKTNFNGELLLNNNNTTYSLNAQELSCLDNISSNVQTQLNNKLNLISNPTNGNLCSMNSLGNVINNNLALLTDKTMTSTSDITLPTSTAIKSYVDNQISQINTNSTIGQAVNYYFTNLASGVSTYEVIQTSPQDLPQDIESAIVNNNEVLIHGYITQNLNRSKISKGVFNFVFYASVDDITSYSYIKAIIYKRDIAGFETLLIDNIKCNDINVVYPNVNTFVATGTLYNDIVLNTTDNIVVKIYLGTTANKNITIYFYHNGNTCSYFSSPLIYTHNDNDSIQGGNSNERYHLTLGQYNNVIVAASTNNNGYLTNTDYNTFNGKQNNIVATTTADYYRGDKTFQPLTKSTIGLSNVDNTSDLNKPISSATQTALNLKNDLITSSTNVLCNSISDINGNLRNELNLMNTRQNVIYVSNINGDDNYNGYSILKPKKTISSALTDTFISSGCCIILCPGTYNETNLTCNRQNLTIMSLGIERGGVININNLTLTHPSSSIRLSGLNITTLNINALGLTYIQYCQIGSLTKQNTGFLQISDTFINTSLLIDGSSINNIVNNNNIGCPITISINSSTSQNNFSNNLVLGPIVHNSGILGINNSTIYSASSSFNAITITNTSILYLSNLSIVNPDNTPAKISVNSTSYYSINNVVYNKSSSTLLGIKLNRNNYYEIINTDSINTNQINNITSTQLSYLNSVSSNIQTQLDNLNNNKMDISNNSIITLNGTLKCNNGTVTISSLELSYLDGLTSNIQNQLNQISNINPKYHKILYVSNIANISGNGYNELSPLDFISEAIDSVLNPNHIIIMPGDYSFDSMYINNKNISFIAMSNNIHPKSNLISVILPEPLSFYGTSNCNFNGFSIRDINLTDHSGSLLFENCLFNNNINVDLSNIVFSNCNFKNITITNTNKTTSNYITFINCVCDLGFFLNNESVNGFIEIYDCQKFGRINNSGNCKIYNSILYCNNIFSNYATSSLSTYTLLNNVENYNNNGGLGYISFNSQSIYNLKNVLYNISLSSISSQISPNNNYNSFDLINLTRILRVNDINITAAEISYLNGLTENLSTSLTNLSNRINNKAGLSENNTFTGINTFNNTINLNNNINANNATITPIELSYLDGLTSNIQTQLNNTLQMKSVRGTCVIGVGNSNFASTVILLKDIIPGITQYLNASSFIFGIASNGDKAANINYAPFHCVFLNGSSNTNQTNYDRVEIYYQCNSPGAARLNLLVFYG